MGAAVVEDVGGVTAATLAELVEVLTGSGVVDTLAGDEVAL